MEKSVTINHFLSNMDIKQYICSAAKGAHLLEYSSDFFQIRELENNKKNIVARLCRIRRTNKPKIGNIKNVEEHDIKEDVIESIHFLYNKNDKTILMQSNNSVASNSGNILHKLLLDTNENLKKELNITIIIRNDAMKEVLSNQGLITKFNISVDKNVSSKLFGDDVNGKSNILNDIQYNSMEMAIKVDVGEIQKSQIYTLFEKYKEGKTDMLKFKIDGGELINVAKFVRKNKINVSINKNKNFITQDFYNKLKALVS